MAQFNITATSATKNRTVTNADTNTREAYNSPAECENQEAADKLAKKFARDLNADDFDGANDWTSTATAV